MLLYIVVVRFQAMGIVKYIGEGLNKKFNVGQALKDGWGKEWESEEALKGLKLQDRKKPKHKVTVEKADWYAGILTIWFAEGGWLCFDHAIEQFKCVD